MTKINVEYADSNLQFEMIPHWVLFHDDLTAQDVRTYACLTRYASMPKGAIPSHKTLADDARCSSSTARRSIERLVEAGAVEVENRGGRKGEAQRSNRYIVRNVPRPPEGTPLSTSEHPPLSTSEQRIHTDDESDRRDNPLSAEADQESEDEPTYHLSHTEAFEALADACGYDAEAIRKVGGGLIGRNAKLLREAGATREEILARADRYRHRHPDWDLTPAALVKWWPTLEPPEGSEDRTCECGQSTGRSHDPRAHDLLLS